LLREDEIREQSWMLRWQQLRTRKEVRVASNEPRVQSLGLILSKTNFQPQLESFPAFD
jgi:hypothetical protein